MLEMLTFLRTSLEHYLKTGRKHRIPLHLKAKGLVSRLASRVRRLVSRTHGFVHLARQDTR